MDDRAGAPAVAVVSYNFWRDQLRGDRTSIGRSILLNHSQSVIVGVAPDGFEGVNLDWGEPPAFWSPMHSQQRVIAGAGDMLSERAARWLDTIGRLKDGVDITAGHSDFQALVQQVAGAYPASDAGYGQPHRPCGVCPGFAFPCCRRYACMLYPRAPRGEGGPYGGAEVRMK